ncbi:type VII secretion protein EccB [Kitasatospora azatica]|uniref:type VII secretion protein EccB n=1 Tax=Kitasatospora azatica TaxID=58347 RepID=UPI00068DBB9F|nr:type VII secretion protein EccB [Kitasatospora azatica]
MQTRRDQLQAHLFVVGRLVSGLVHGEPDVPQTPMRRSTMGFFAGTMLTILIVAGVAVAGFISPPPKSELGSPNTILVEKETGARFLFADGQLRPVLNHTSALLVVGSATPAVKTVTRASLSGVPHGLPVGIPDAPESLPTATALTTGPWSVCATSVPDPNGQPRPVVTVEVGAGKPVTALDDGRALVVRTPDGAGYLAWHDRRFRMSGTARTALGYEGVQPLPVGAAWLDALPAGPDLKARQIPGRGQSGPVIDGRATRVGQILKADNPAAKGDYFVLLADGLSPLSPVDEALLLGDPGSQAAYGDQTVAPITVSSAALAAAHHSAVSSVTADYPPSVPQPLGVTSGSQRVACYTVAPGAQAGPTVTVGTADAPDPLQALPPQPTQLGTGDSAVADHVLVPPVAGCWRRRCPRPG